MRKVLKLGYFYRDLLNLYGDTGNVDILAFRARGRGVSVEVIDISVGESFPTDLDMVFMGGGPDSGQKLMYEDLLKNKKSFLKDYIESQKVGLFICGSYQLLGKYYKSADGSILCGLEIFELYTEHFGLSKPRCIGNTTAVLDSVITNSPVYKKVAEHYVSGGNTIVGFENHGGRTYLGNTARPFAQVSKGHGNNSEDHT